MAGGTLTVAGLSAKPETVRTGFIGVADGIDGAVRIPIVIINGHKSGPRLWLTSGMHGTEYSGPAAIGRIAKEVDPKKLKGAVVCIPVANVPALQARSYVNPVDNTNLWTSFPGDPNGSLTQRMAHVIFSELKTKADCVLDLHSGFADIMIESHVYCYKKGATGKRSEEIAKAFGFELIIRADGPGSLLEEACKIGIPTIVTEVGGEGRLRKEHVDLQVEGVLNVMKHLGMIAGKPTVPSTVIVSSDVPEAYVRTTKPGILHVLVKANQKVKKGQPVLKVMNIFGETVETVTSPHNGYVAEIRTWAYANAGDQVAYILPF